MFSCINIGIILLYTFILFKVLKKDQKLEMCVLTLLTIFFLNNIEGFTDGENDDNTNAAVNGDTSIGDDETNTTAKSLINESNKNSNLVENGGSKVKENPIIKEMNMGPYDGICLKTGNKDHWMKSPDNTELIPNDALYSYLGSQGPIKMRLSDQSQLIGPPIDGVNGSDEKMFMFANNKSSLACCPSTFSTSTGCVCTTENQRDFVASRGVLPAYENSNESNSEF